MPSRTMRRAVAYARTASSRVGDQAAIEQQLLVCHRVASELGVRVDQEFADRGVSGLTLDRVALKELLAYVAATPVDYVICADGYRLSRDYEHFRYLARCLETQQARIVFADASADLEAACRRDVVLTAGWDRGHAPALPSSPGSRPPTTQTNAADSGHRPWSR